MCCKGTALSIGLRWRFTQYIQIACETAEKKEKGEGRSNLESWGIFATDPKRGTKVDVSREEFSRW